MTDSDVLKEARLLQSSNPEVGRRLAALRPRSRALAAGQIVFEPGEAADCIYLLADGRAGGQSGAEPLVQIRLAKEGSGQARFARVVKGDIFGEAEFVASGLDPRKGIRITQARALTPARAIALPWSDLAALFEIDPAIRTRFLKLASRRLIDAVWAQHSQGHEDPDIVLADWLVEYAADVGIAASNRVSFPRKLGQAEIAEELGVSRETISRRLKEWERSGLVISSAAGLEVVDYARLVRIAGLSSGRDREALARAVAEIAAAIDRGDLMLARNIAADMLRYYPASPELLHQAALVAARSGDADEAMALLSANRLLAEGDLDALRERIARALNNPFATIERLAAEDWTEADPHEDDEAIVDGRMIERLVTDIAALEARLLKDRAFDPGAPDRERAADASHRAYAAIYRRTGNWYAGINAAAMALASGDAGGGQKLARDIVKRVGTTPADYWGLATLGEALLIGGDREGGLEALKRASQAPDATDMSRASTALQLARLAPRLGLDPAHLRQLLGVPTVAVITGHLFRGGEMDGAAQATAADTIRRQAQAILAERRVGHVYGALACGADIVIAEAAMDLGIDFHAVVPFPLPRYAELSVDIGDPKDAPGSWRKRFDDAISRVASLALVEDEIPLDRDLDGHFFYGFRSMAGQALMRAATLQAECRLIAVTDGAEPANIAGSNRAVDDWIAAGRAVDPIAFPFARRTTGPRPRGASSFRACVFLWDVEGGGADRDAVAGSGLDKDADFQVVQRASRAGQEGTCIIAPTLESALRLAEACAEGRPSLRVVCDFGPVLGADLVADPKMIARLGAASDMPGFRPGRPLATQSFAAQAIMEFGDRLEWCSVGRADDARASDAESSVRARRRPGSAVFGLALKRA